MEHLLQAGHQPARFNQGTNVPDAKGRARKRATMSDKKETKIGKLYRLYICAEKANHFPIKDFGLFGENRPSDNVIKRKIEEQIALSEEIKKASDNER
jgi:hypothetical protein